MASFKMSDSVIRLAGQKKVFSDLMRDFNVKDIEKDLIERKRQAEDGARELLEKARDLAHTMQREASERGHAEGYRDGYAEGIKKGETDGYERVRAEESRLVGERISALAGALFEIIEDFRAARRLLMRQAERDLLTLAFAIAEKIVKKSYEYDPSLVQQNLKAAIELAGERTDVDVYLSHGDIAALKDYAPKVFAMTGGGGDSVRFHEDPALKPGDVRLKSRRSTVDAAIDMQIERVWRQIFGREMPAESPLVDTEFSVTRAVEKSRAERAIGADAAPTTENVAPGPVSPEAASGTAPQTETPAADNDAGTGHTTDDAE